LQRKSMHVRRWSIIGASVGVFMILSGLFVLAWNSAFIVFTRRLEVSDFTDHGGDYGANVLDYDIRVASIAIRVPSLAYSSTIPALVSIWHERGTMLKSLKLVFSSSDFFSMALEVPGGYPWPSVEFHRTSDDKGVLFYAADLGFQGTGTVTLEFSLEMQSTQRRLDLNVYVQFTMQKDAPFTFSRQVAEAQLNTQTLRV